MEVKSVPRSTYTIPIDKDQLVRPYASYECLPSRRTKERREYNHFVKELINFESTARIPPDVIEYLRIKYSQSGFQERDVLKASKPKNRGKKYFFIDPCNRSSMIAVIEGKRPIKEGFHMIVAHGDAPSLIVKSSPLRIEWDPDLTLNHPGPRLSCVACGGVQRHQWPGTKVKVIGYSEEKNRRRIEFDGLVLDYSANIDRREKDTLKEAFPHDKTFEVITGHRSYKEMLKYIGFKNKDDFSSSKLWVIPKDKEMMMLPEEKDPKIIAGYGHDDRAGVYAASEALLKTTNPEYTSLLWITGSEEVGDPPPSGARSALAKLVIEHVLDNQQVKSTSLEKRIMFANSSLIIGDVTVSPFSTEYEKTDHLSASKIGNGVAITTAHGQESTESFPRFIRKIRRIINSKKPICAQMCGNIEDQESLDLEDHPWIGGYLIEEGVQWAWVGPPCAVLHSHNEVISPADLWWTSMLYQRFFNSKIKVSSN